MNTYTILDNPTLYPSANMVVSNKGYTKHYYAEAERAFATISIQHLQYRPFGESYVSEHTASPYTDCFTFTGKERDEETGYTYHGARYYDASLMCSWFSVDPLSDKYPSLSPYNYCAWNPVKLVDPDGRDTIRINLSTGEIEQSFGGNLCEIINNDEIIYSLNCNIMCTTYMANARGKNKLVGKNEFEHSEDGKKVFDQMSKLASDENTRMPTEWDYYSLSDGTGHLLTSFQEGEVRSRQSDYTNDNVISYDHYHPYQRNSAIPSKSDFDHRDRINDGPNTVTCRLHTGGKSYCFNGLKRDDRNGVLINSILSIVPQMKEVER